jgi:RNA polymerase sigma-70 factor, ECF subfamily
MADRPQVDWRSVVEQICQFDPLGEETLYRELNSGARQFLQRRLGTSDVEDHVHDVFLIVVQTIRRGALREPERLMGFVRTILYRQVSLGISRIVGARKNISLSDSASQLSFDPDAEQLVLDHEKVAAMKQGMKRMKRKDVEVLTRFYLRGQPPERICEEMALTMAQFTLRKSRAKAALTALIQRLNAAPLSSDINRR